MTDQATVDQLIRQIAEAWRELRALQAWDQLALAELRSHRSSTLPMQFGIRQTLHQDMHTLVARIYWLMADASDYLKSLPVPARQCAEVVLGTYGEALRHVMISMSYVRV